MKPDSDISMVIDLTRSLLSSIAMSCLFQKHHSTTRANLSVELRWVTQESAAIEHIRHSCSQYLTEGPTCRHRSKLPEKNNSASVPQRSALSFILLFNVYVSKLNHGNYCVGRWLNCSVLISSVTPQSVMCEEMNRYIPSLNDLCSSLEYFNYKHLSPSWADKIKLRIGKTPIISGVLIYLGRVPYK